MNITSPLLRKQSSCKSRTSSTSTPVIDKFVRRMERHPAGSLPSSSPVMSSSKQSSNLDDDDSADYLYVGGSGGGPGSLLGQQLGIDIHLTPPTASTSKPTKLQTWLANAAVAATSAESVYSSAPARSSSSSGDSLGRELLHFRPIAACPRTPPKRLPGGGVHDPPVIRSMPQSCSQGLSVTGRDKQWLRGELRLTQVRFYVAQFS